MRQVALMRGINVGGKHSVPMAALVQVFVALGCSEVRTYIQSGNVVFTSPGPAVGAATIAAAFEKRFGFAAPVVLRTAAELAQVVANNPYPDADVKHLHVVFLAEPLEATKVSALRALVAGKEQLSERGRELYLYLPGGSGNSKVAAGCVAPKLPRTNTIRNWTTTLKLREMVEA